MNGAPFRIPGTTAAQCSGTLPSRGPGPRGQPGSANQPGGADAPLVTTVELIWQQGLVEHWIRFGSRSFERIIDRHRRIIGFDAGSIFAFVRWEAGDWGTVAARIDILRAVGPEEPFQTLPFVRPGGEILLRLSGWSKVQRAFLAIDAVEALGIAPDDVAPDHWRHVHSRLSAGLEPRPYSLARHEAWLLRRRILS